MRKAIVVAVSIVAVLTLALIALTAIRTAAPQSTQQVLAAELKAGDRAPEFAIRKWVKGMPVDEFNSGTTYVMEFWATWCGPCRKSIPHLTDMQKKFAAKNVVFIGVSNEKDDAKVEAFVKEMGDKMDYRVALDKNDTTMRNWMTAADQRGIPRAFLVDKTGKLVWIGHPMALEAELEKLVGK